MGRMKEVFTRLQEEIYEEYRTGEISKIRAAERLQDLGFKIQEAFDLLDKEKLWQPS